MQVEIGGLKIKVGDPRSWLFISAWGLAICAGFYYFSYVSADPDLWGHLRFGADLWQNRVLKSIDPYAFTTVGNPWINHEWLSELVFFGLYRFLGDSGLLWGKALIGILVLTIILGICHLRPCNPIVLAVAAIPVTVSMAPGFMIRPQLASYLFFAVFLYLINLYYYRQRNCLFLLPLLMGLWVNLHGGFLMGVVLLGIITAWETISGLAGRAVGARWKTLWPVLTTTLLATLVNPYGVGLHVFLYRSLRIDRPIGEWDPVVLLDSSFAAFKLLAIVFVLISLIVRNRNKGWETVGLFFLLYAAIRHQRHIPFFSIMAAPYIVHWVSCLAVGVTERTTRSIHVRTLRTFVTMVLFFGAAGYAAAGFQKYSTAQWRIIVNPDAYPVSAVRFMKQNHFSGNLVLPFEWGEYAIWKLYPACRVSIDGRFRTVYSESVIRDHFQMFQNQEKFAALIDKYPADIALVRQVPWINEFIRKHQSRWLYVYSDPVALIVVRNHSRNQSLIEAFNRNQFVHSKAAPWPFFP